MLNRMTISLLAIGLLLCSCVSISIDTAYRKAWDRALPEHRIQYLELKPVMTEDDADSFLQMTDETQREEWLRKFWKAKDPTPTTERNEFKEEHQRRVAYARQYFGSHFRGNRLWDDRGEVYIKYGEPDERVTQVEGVYGVGKEEQEARKQEGEVWRYYKYDLTLQFQDNKLLGFYELTPHVEVQSKDVYGETYEVQDEVDFKSTVATKIDIPREIYHHDYEGDVLDYALDIVRFRNTGDNYEVDVNLGLPIEQLGKKDANYVSFVKSIVVFDNNYKEVKRDSSIVNVRVGQAVNSLVIDQNRFVLNSGEYKVAVEVRDLVSSRIGIYKKDILLPGYVHPEQREISQIVMATDVRKATQDDSLLMQRNGLVISPLPSRIYFADQKIYFYYEIYDLKLDKSGKAYYIIQADLINTKTRKRTTLYKTNPVECTKSNTYEIDEIDALELKPGDYILTIKVKDVLADKEKNTVTAFRVMKD
ncbi:MAG TPA: GWxTD domain-containing protein [candidate division Zixibacteria bacterium]